MTFTPNRKAGFQRLALFVALRGVIWLAWWGLALPSGKAAITALVSLDLIVLILGIFWVLRIETAYPVLAWTRRLVLVIIAAVAFSASLDRVALAYRAAPRPPAPPQHLETIGTSAIFSGPITLASFEALAETLRQQPNLVTLRLSSNGGHIPSARGMARLVQEAGLATEAEGTCASACSLVFMSGKIRQLRPDARLGFHAYRLNTQSNILDPRDEENRDRQFMQSMGVASWFLDEAFATRHEAIWFPDLETLRRAGVLTD
ncbi:MAG: hypothetical protein WBA92_08160 [Pseudorhodobacter sp.]